MSTFKLPASGEDLAYATRDFTSHSYEQVRERLEWTYLPKAILAIWEHSPIIKEIRKKSPGPIGEIRDICHIIVTFPGSAAIERIRDVLIRGQLIPNSEGQFALANEIAEEIFDLTMRYTRVQNLSRHLRTAVNSHLKILGIETSRDRSRTSSQYETAFFKPNDENSTRDRIYSLRSALLKTERDVDDWADDVNSLLFLLPKNAALNTGTAEQITLPRQGIAAGAISTYKLRFKQAIAATLGIDLSSPDVRIEKTSNKSIEGLLRELEEMPSDFADLYRMLENLRPKRNNRPDIRTKDYDYEVKAKGADLAQKNLVKHVLNLSGRELVIEGSRGAFTPELALGLIKTVSLQLTIDPDASELVAAFESGGQILRVRIQDPKKSDRTKLSALLMQLVS